MQRDARHSTATPGPKIFRAVRRCFSRSSLFALFVVARSAEAAVNASGDGGNPISTATYGGDIGGFVVTEDVALNPLAGPWHKELVNLGSEILSGERVSVFETLTNVGSAWGDWHEAIFSTTFGGSTYAGFLFDKDSLILSADRGSGIVVLTEGVDYALETTDFTGPGAGGDNDGWVAISIVFAPGAEIESGETLLIEKQIFEVFLDVNTWASEEAAVISQYPTPVPEPPKALLLAAGLAAVAALGARARTLRARADSLS